MFHLHQSTLTLDAVDRFTYLGSTIDSNLSLDAEINIRIAKAAAVMSKLNMRVWQNNNLTPHMTKLHVYQACVLSTPLYSSEVCTTYTRQEKKLNSFHLRCLDDRGHWKSVVKAGMRIGEDKRSVHEAEKREKKKQKSSHPAHPPQPTIFICHIYGMETVVLELDC